MATLNSTPVTKHNSPFVSFTSEASTASAVKLQPMSASAWYRAPLTSPGTGLSRASATATAATGAEAFGTEAGGGGGCAILRAASIANGDGPVLGFGASRFSGSAGPVCGLTGLIPA